MTINLQARTGLPAGCQLNFEQLAGLVMPAAVTALPTTNLFDGREIYYVADATNGVVWHLKYRVGVSPPWAMVGGPPMFSEVATSETTTSATYAALATAGPSIVLPIAGTYMVEQGVQFTLSANTTAFMSYDIGGTGAADADGMRLEVGSVGNREITMRTRVKTGLTAVTLTSKYKTASGTLTAENRWMSALPVRVG